MIKILDNKPLQRYSNVVARDLYEIEKEQCRKEQEDKLFEDEGFKKFADKKVSRVQEV